MARSPEAPQSPETMTPAQLERRSRLLDAVVALVADGVDDELQMKDIADRAGVALGTVYRYFSSKDHLVAAALFEWASTLDAKVARRPLPDGPPATRLAAVLRQALRAYQRQPAFARLLVMVANSNDPFASECYGELGTVVFRTLGSAIPDVESDVRGRVLQVVGAVWYHCLVGRTMGRMTIADVYRTLESTCTLLLSS
jgi:AcrR family transcriptional regulator